MREYKFRGKTLESFGNNDSVVIPKGTWIYGGIIYDDTRAWIDATYYGQIAVDKETVGQFTGLHDKNGKEIYEGDIIQYGDIHKGIVEYSEKYAQFILKETDNISDEYEALGEFNIIVFEVIGNIYDNKELLNETNR